MQSTTVQPKRKPACDGDLIFILILKISLHRVMYITMPDNQTKGNIIT